MSNGLFKRKSRLIYSIKILLDVFLVNFGFYLAFVFRFGGKISSRNITPFYEIIPIISLLTLIFFRVYGVFENDKESYVETIYSAFLSLIFISITTMAVTFFNRGFAFPRSVFIIAVGIQFICIALWKFIVYKISNIFRKPKAAIIIGNNGEAQDVARKILSKRDNIFEVKYISNNINAKTYNLIDEVDAVFVCSSLDSSEKEAVITYCVTLDKVTYIIPELFDITLSNAKLTQFNNVPVFCIENFNLSIEQRILKRSFDIIVSLIGIILSLPLMILVYTAIRIYDGGPAIFSQERVTRKNKKFKLYKFRTMIINAEKYTGPVLAKDKDSRIIPIGRFLRSTRIDELPQLFNVLKGDMSIVGPRPERQYFIEQFQKKIPDFQYRVAVKAGVTGLAQVLGKYTTNPKDKLRFDLVYIRNYSFLLDLKIMLQTIKVIFMKESSEGVKSGKDFEELIRDLDYTIYEELGIVKMKKFS